MWRISHAYHPFDYGDHDVVYMYLEECMEIILFISEDPNSYKTLQEENSASIVKFQPLNQLKLSFFP